MSKHTAGPWQLIEKPPASRSDHGWRQISLPAGHIVACSAHQQFTQTLGEAKDRAIANGILMSAAPDLLAALEAIQQQWANTGGVSGDAISQARAAISKAKGQQ